MDTTINKNEKILISLENRLSEKIIINKNMFDSKSVEKDLNGNLNPTNLLNEKTFNQKIIMSFPEFNRAYVEINEKELRMFAQKNYPTMEFGTLTTDLIGDYRNYKVPKTFLGGLEARLYRTQLSIYTEYHAYYMCKKVFINQPVLRDVMMDKLGADFSITYPNCLYLIHFMSDTKRAKLFRNEKEQNKNSNGIKGLHVNILYDYRHDANGLHACKILKNGMGVVTEDYIKYFKSEIENNNIANNVKGKINIIGVNEKGFIYGEVKSTSTGIKCDVCKIGEIAEKNSEHGKFYACNNYPFCRTIYIKNKDSQFIIKNN